MSKSNSFENALMLLIFNNTNIANIGDATGLRGSTAAGNLYCSLHTGDPGEAGDQTTSEIAYTSYARAAVARNSGGWTVTGASVSPTATISFVTGTGGSGTAGWIGIGSEISGAGLLMYKGALSPTIVCGNGVTPQIGTGTTIAED